MTTRSSRWNRRTPSEGYLETLKIADNNGTLEFWREGKLIHSIRLGRCFSFAMMDESHALCCKGGTCLLHCPTLICKALERCRKWHQSYRTLTYNTDADPAFMKPNDLPQLQGPAARSLYGLALKFT